MVDVLGQSNANGHSAPGSGTPTTHLQQPEAGTSTTSGLTTQINYKSSLPEAPERFSFIDGFCPLRFGTDAPTRLVFDGPGRLHVLQEEMTQFNPKSFREDTKTTIAEDRKNDTGHR